MNSNNIYQNKKIVLAPMAGITSVGYRHFMIPFGIDYAVTEMVSDMGLIYGNEETKRYVTYDNEEVPVGVQLFGNNPETIAKAALISLNLNKNIAFFDLNMGCPVNKVTKVGSGSALMKNPKLCGEIVRKLKEVTDLPITAKIRLGWDNNSINYLEVIKELEEAGVSAIAIHARTRNELYSGYPHYELLKDLRLKMHVPLIISGNIFSLEDAINALDITKADGIMIARGGIGNPYLIKQIKYYFENGIKLPNPTLEEQIKYCLSLADCYIVEFGELKAMRIYRGIASKFFNGFPNSKTLKAQLSQELTTKESLIKILNDYKLNNIQD